MEYGCIGEHLPHSFSREIHQLIGDYDYQLREIERGDLCAFMKAADFRAINVTIPYKEAVIPYLSEISPKARAIGAVNTIVNRDGKLFGDNTDFSGMDALLQRLGIDPCGKKVLILGTGGTSKTAKALMESHEARAIYRVSRRKSEEDPGIINILRSTGRLDDEVKDQIIHAAKSYLDIFMNEEQTGLITNG